MFSFIRGRKTRWRKIKENIISLKRLVEIAGEEVAREYLSGFRCEKDSDIENFLKDKAILFEQLGKSRTFLIYDEDSDEIKILAYFTLALQIVRVPENLSNRKIKFLDGFNAKIKGETITEFPAILIGQIGKNDTYKKDITGAKVMDYCLSTVLNGQSYLGGRIITLECKRIPYLVKFYTDFGFAKLERDYQEGELLQYIRVLQQDELIEQETIEKNV